MTPRQLASQAAKSLLKFPVHVYRYAISPLTGPTCRFHPTCSTYALDAIEKHGPIKGTWLAVRRLSRCHPVSWLGGSEGFDPVPETSANHKLSGSQE